MSYFINRIYIENFKFINNADIYFNKSNLVVLDGPNGYGKTTIFDIIELAITGKISRIDSNQTDTRSGCNDILYLKEKDKDAIVKVEFISNEDKFTVVKKIDSRERYGKLEKRSNNWNLFNTYLINEFNENYTDDNKVCENEIIKRFQDYDIGRYYDLLYYIQQEDSTSFLKKSEKERAQILSKLFDTKKEEEELEKLEKFKIKTKKYIEQLKSKKKEEININEYEEINTQKAEYKRIIISKEIDWDKENLNISSLKQRDDYKKQISNIKEFINNFSSFLNRIKNEKIDFLLKDKDLIKSYVLCSHFYPNYTLIEQKYKERQFILESKKLFENISIDSLNKMNHNNLFNKLNIDDSRFNQAKYEELLNRLNDLKNNESNLAQFIRKLNSSRIDLYERNVDLIEKEKFSKISLSKCMLCGNEYLNNESLKIQVDQYTENLNDILDKSQKSNSSIINTILNIISENILYYIENYLDKDKEVIEPKFYNQLSKYINKYKENIGINDFIKDLNVDISKYINREYKPIENIDEIYNDIYEDLNSKKEILNIEYQSLEKEIDFKSIYQNIFNKSDKDIKSVDINELENKKKYIDYKYYTNLINEQEKIKKYNQSIELKVAKLQKIYNEEIKNSIDIYTKNIRKHRSDIIKDIEIPFYIYTGKIIQDYQRGLGVFIKEYEEFKNLKFVSNTDSDHDAINCLSSGQLSALVISFTLALNKVYGNKKLSSILIDDPLQSMDDINMISFMELMRNEFTNKQIIMSTHEDEISLFMRYKFAVNNLKETRINVKSEIK